MHPASCFPGSCSAVPIPCGTAHLPSGSNGFRDSKSANELASRHVATCVYVSKQAAFIQLFRSRGRFLALHLPNSRGCSMRVDSEVPAPALPWRHKGPPGKKSFDPRNTSVRPPGDALRPGWCWYKILNAVSEMADSTLGISCDSSSFCAATRATMYSFDCSKI